MEKNEGETPTKKVLELKNQGLSDQEIMSSLGREGYSSRQVYEALNQAMMSRGKFPYEDIPSPEFRPSVMEEGAPTKTFVPPQEVAPERIEMELPRLDYDRTGKEEIESLIESVVEEKWKSLLESFGDLNLWKEKVRTNIISIKQELLRLEQRFDSLQSSLLGKVTEYDKHMAEIGTDIKALEKVLQKILGPLTTNVKELSRITEKLKK